MVCVCVSVHYTQRGHTSLKCMKIYNFKKKTNAIQFTVSFFILHQKYIYLKSQNGEFNVKIKNRKP